VGPINFFCWFLTSLISLVSQKNRLPRVSPPSILLRRNFSRRSRALNPYSTLTQRHNSPCEITNNLDWALDQLLGWDRQGDFFNPTLKFGVVQIRDFFVVYMCMRPMAIVYSPFYAHVYTYHITHPSRVGGIEESFPPPWYQTGLSSSPSFRRCCSHGWTPTAGAASSPPSYSYAAGATPMFHIALAASFAACAATRAAATVSSGDPLS
jgi:hypothetical protein